MPPEGYIKRYTSISAVIYLLSRRELALLDPQSWDDRNDRHYMSLYREHSRSNGLYAACFTQAVETYHHWRVFTGTSDGACVEFDRNALEQHITGNSDIRFGDVLYRTLTSIDKATVTDRDKLPFMKRIGFEPEKEFRVVATSDEPQSAVLGLPIDLKLIRHVYFNPWIPEGIFGSVKPLLLAIEGCSHIRITRSQLIDSQRWKDAGNRIMGKPPSTRVRLPSAKQPVAKGPKAGKKRRRGAKQRA